MRYLWTEEVEMPEFPSLEGDRKTDVLIIGGGMAGILCAYFLQKAGVDYLLVEGGRIGNGITKGTTAVLSAQHSTLYTDLVRAFGEEQARLYLKVNLEALERFREMAQTIPCDWEERPSILYSTEDKETMEREAKTVQSLGFAAEFQTECPVPVPVVGAVCFPGMAQFHPLKFLAGAAKGLSIFERTFVHRLDQTVAFTDTGRITAKKVIVATHFPFLNRRGLYFMKLYQKRSFVVALERAPQLNCTAEDHAESGMYFRNYKNLLLVGGGDRRTGARGGGFDAVRAFIQKTFPHAVETYAWANQDCMSLDGVPYIGTYSPRMPDVFVATGFNEWGMSTSMAAASLLSHMILGQEDSATHVFSPDRSLFKPQLFSNLGTTLVDFMTPTKKRCSHMGCALKWNPHEHSWDCPCHGSRFDEQGELINNPAMKNSCVEP
jgi:glycine/D-amino acid oxidase-like deaminating enzyme